LKLCHFRDFSVANPRKLGSFFIPQKAGRFFLNSPHSIQHYLEQTRSLLGLSVAAGSPSSPVQKTYPRNPTFLVNKGSKPGKCPSKPQLLFEVESGLHNFPARRTYRTEPAKHRPQESGLNYALERFPPSARRSLPCSTTTFTGEPTGVNGSSPFFVVQKSEYGFFLAGGQRSPRFFPFFLIPSPCVFRSQCSPDGWRPFRANSPPH